MYGTGRRRRRSGRHRPPGGSNVAAIDGSETVGTDRQRTPGVVTEIFIRVNSAGASLSQADFAMSKIAANESYGGKWVCTSHT